MRARISSVLVILVQFWLAESTYNRTWEERIPVPRTKEQTSEPQIETWFYLTIPIGVLALVIVIIVLYKNGKRRGAVRRRRRQERSVNISDPVPGTVISLMGNASVDVVPVASCTVGKPQLKSKMLQTFNDSERRGSSFGNEFSDGAVGAKEEYYNIKDSSCEQSNCASSSQQNFKRSQNVLSDPKSGRVESATSKKTPFVPPAISVELARRQNKKDIEIERENRNKKCVVVLPNCKHKEQLIYENQNSASVSAARSLENFRGEPERLGQHQTIYINKDQALFRKEKSVEDFSANQLAPELPLKQRFRRTDGFCGGQNKTWEKGISSNYENFFGGDCVGGTWQREAVYLKDKNRAHVIRQATNNNKNDGTDYENLPSVGEGLLPPKTQQFSAQKATLLESRGVGFTRKDNKAVRRSRVNLEAMLKQSGVKADEVHRDGKVLFESKESLCSNSHQTNTENLMQMLGLSVNFIRADQAKTYQDDGYLPDDDYDDNIS